LIYLVCYQATAPQQQRMVIAEGYDRTVIPV